MQNAMISFPDYLKNLSPFPLPEKTGDVIYKKLITNDVIRFFEVECGKNPFGEPFVKAYFKQKDFLIKSLEIITDHLSDPGFDLNRFTSDMCISKSTLHRTMHSLTGVSPCDFIHYLRMRYAQMILTDTSFQVAEVAGKVGFNCPKHFTYSFRRRYGLSPKLFREKLKQSQSQVVVPSNDKLMLQKVTNLIKDNISDTGYGLSNLAFDLGASKSTLYRRIKSITGLSPIAFIRSVKLNHAKSLLRRRNGDVLDVVYASGFSDPKYFSRCFRNEFGVLPREVINF
ncbi:MAG: AraC family transcriptional regulator [Bacteroidota bacterium]|nr:AraC family transcriptional regulator [Bacteroidota bacterium]